MAGTTDIIIGYPVEVLPSRRWEQRGGKMTVSHRPVSAAERKRAGRLDIARRLYHALAAKDPDRIITLCDERGRVMAQHDPRPEQDDPEIAS
jgi:hypothetical protein